MDETQLSLQSDSSGTLSFNSTGASPGAVGLLPLYAQASLPGWDSFPPLTFEARDGAAAKVPASESLQAGASRQGRFRENPSYTKRDDTHSSDIETTSWGPRSPHPNAWRVPSYYQKKIWQQGSWESPAHTKTTESHSPLRDLEARQPTPRWCAFGLREVTHTGYTKALAHLISGGP